MRHFVFFAAFMLCIALISVSASALPMLFDPKPANNTFVGKGNVNFSINITSATLNTSSVLMFLISEDAYLHGDKWDNFTMACTSLGSNWQCIRTLSFSIAGTDTLEFLYFNATDTDGINSTGNETNPIRFRIDRTPPNIVFTTPKNESYVGGGNVTVEVDFFDTISGINASTAQTSFDNATWSKMTSSSSTKFRSSFNSSAYANNQSVNIFVMISDIVNNTGNKNITVRVDNEIPALTVVSPADGAFLQGSANFSINASDAFSGIDTDNVKFQIAGTNTSMSCSGANAFICTSAFNTATLSDNTYTIKFFAFDAAGNFNSSSRSVTLKNSNATVQIAPSSGYVRGTVAINISVSNTAGSATSVSLAINGTPASVSCNADFTSCTHSFDSASRTDGAYGFRAAVNNTLGTQWVADANLTADNTLPSVALTVSPVVKGIFDMRAAVSDANADRGRVTFAIKAGGAVKASGAMSCATSGASLECLAQYNSAQLSDGAYSVEITALDLAGNSRTASQGTTVDNIPPTFLFLKIEPVQRDKEGEFNFTVGMNDTATGVSKITLSFRYPSGTSVLALSRVDDVWYAKALVKSMGTHYVSVIAEDNNGNTKTYTDVGYFFVGALACGDGACQSNENYCNCAKDCAAPLCGSGQAVECNTGIPVCAKPASCGDSICSAAETCSTCSKDCGVCAALAAGWNNLGVVGGEAGAGDAQGSSAGAGASGNGAGISAIGSALGKFVEQNPFFLALVIIVVIVVVVALRRYRRHRKNVSAGQWESYLPKK